MRRRLHSVAMIVSVVLLLFLVDVTRETSGDEWSKIFGGSQLDRGRSVDQTSDDGYVFTGGTGSWGAGYEDVWLVKTDSAGNHVWNKTFGSIEYDEGSCVEQTADGGYIITGYRSNSGGGSRDSELWLIKTYADGEMEWNKTFTEILTTRVKWGEGHSVMQTSDGGYIVLGSVQESNSITIEAIWLIKTDSSGGKTWEYVLEGDGNPPAASAMSVQQTADGGYIVSGSVKRPDGKKDIWLIKTDATGVAVWNQTYGRMYGDIPGDEYPHSARQTGDGGYIVGGYSSSRYGYRGWVIKTDAFGEKIWEIVLDPSDLNGATCAAKQTSDGGYMIFGSAPDQAGRSCVKVTKTDADGNKWSEKLVTICPYVYPYDGGQKEDGGYVFVADKTTAPPGYTDAALIYTPNLFHDIAIENVAFPRTVVGQGLTVNISATVRNQGNFTETLNVSTYANATLIQTQSVTLPTASSIILVFVWNTTSFAKGNYTMKASVNPVPGEWDTTDNSLTNGQVIVSIIGDVTGADGWPDGRCDVRDLRLVAKYFEQSVPPALPDCDIAGQAFRVPDGRVDLRDIATIAENFGRFEP